MINVYGGDPGLRDRGLLESAVSQAEAGIGDDYFHSFPFGMAATYAYHLILNHPFVDGNKRMGVAAAFLFLQVNGYLLDCTERELESFGLGIATGAITKEEAEDFLRRSCGGTGTHDNQTEGS